MPSVNSIFNGVYWTLGVEMRWYLLCPFLIMLFRRSRPAFFGVGVIAWALYALAKLPSSDVGFLPCFMLGIVAADLRLRYVGTRERPWLYAIAGITLAIASREQSQTSGYDHVDYLWYLACFVCVLVAVARRGDPIMTWKPLALGRGPSASISCTRPSSHGSCGSESPPRSRPACASSSVSRFLRSLNPG